MILEVNLFAFAYRLFRRDFSPLDGTYCIYEYQLTSINCKLTSRIFVYSTGHIASMSTN